MFVKLTRLDNSPIWLNASFIVTVEPRKGGGAIVVPIGDGLDYDVRETPESVLEMLSGAPVPAVVPVPAPKGLTKTPEDVSPEKPEEASEKPVEKPVRKTTRKRTKAKTEEAPAAEDAEPAPAKSAKKPRAPRKPKLPELTLTEEQVERLRKMAPKSIRKLQNTLVSQFKVTETESVIKALEAHAILTLADERVVWTN